MRTLSCVAIVLLLSVCVSAQQVQPADVKPCSISGTVVSTDGKPLQRATVTLTGTGAGMEKESATATSNEDGTFEFKNLKPGEYRAAAEKTGFTNQRGLSAQNAKVKLSAGENATGVLLRLAATAAISGRLLDENGEPVSDVMVFALQQRWVMGQRQSFPVQQATSDDRGEFRIHGLPPGKYYVLASRMRRSMNATKTYAPVYFPNAASLEAASLLQLRSGDDTPVNLTLLPAKGVTVRGRVKGATSPGISIMLRTPGAGVLGIFSGATSVAKEDGTFEIKNVTPGKYNVQAMSVGTDGMRQAQKAIEVGQADIDGVDVAFDDAEATVEFKGSVRCDCPAMAKLENVTVLLQPANPADLFEQNIAMLGGGSTKTEKDLTFKMKATSGARVRLLTSGAALKDFYIKSTMVGGKDTVDSGFTVTRGLSATPVEIVLSAHGARVEGAVTDAHDKPIANAFIVGVPTGALKDRYDLMLRSQTDQKGQFTLSGVRPGDYTLFALDGAGDGVRS